MDHQPAPPRLFGIAATEAPVVAVIRRGPTDWCQLGRWDIAAPAFEPGAWLHGVIAPQKCDVSPDGRWFAASIHQPGARWEAGTIYESISRLPWLQALAAWEMGTTYTTGVHFTEERSCVLGEPDVGDVAPCLRQWGLAVNPAIQFAVERRSGWTETDDTPPRAAGGPFDERRAVTMHKRSPLAGSTVELRVAGSFAGFRSVPGHHEPAEYSLIDGDQVLVALDDVQWADWSHDGKLLVATTSGHLQIREVRADGATAPTFDADLAALAPDPAPAPDWAASW